MLQLFSAPQGTPVEFAAACEEQNVVLLIVATT